MHPCLRNRIPSILYDAQSVLAFRFTLVKLRMYAYHSSIYLKHNITKLMAFSLQCVMADSINWSDRVKSPTISLVLWTFIYCLSLQCLMEIIS